MRHGTRASRDATAHRGVPRARHPAMRRRRDVGRGRGCCASEVCATRDRRLTPCGPCTPGPVLSLPLSFSVCLSLARAALSLSISPCLLSLRLSLFPFHNRIQSACPDCKPPRGSRHSRQAGCAGIRVRPASALGRGRARQLAATRSCGLSGRSCRTGERCPPVLCEPDMDRCGRGEAAACALLSRRGGRACASWRRGAAVRRPQSRAAQGGPAQGGPAATVPVATVPRREGSTGAIYSDGLNAQGGLNRGSTRREGSTAAATVPRELNSCQTRRGVRRAEPRRRRRPQRRKLSSRGAALLEPQLARDVGGEPQVPSRFPACLRPSASRLPGGAGPAPLHGPERGGESCH